MAEYENQRFRMSGVPIPPIGVYAAEGATWPATPYRLTVLSIGDPAARLRAIGLGANVRAEAQRVVVGVPTGPWVDISTTDDFEITAAADDFETFDLRFVMLARAGGFVRCLGRLAVVSSRGGGW